MSENDPWKNWYQEPTPSDPESADRTVSMPQPSNRPTFEPTPGSGAGGGYGAGGYGAGGYGGGAGAGGSAGGGGWGAQPPLVSPPGAPGAPGVAPGRGGAGSGRRWRFWGQPGRHGRRIALVIGVVIVLIIAGTAGTYFWINGKLNRSVALPAYSGTSAGTNWLIAGSDQRTGISRSQQDQLHLGSEGADASDSLMLLHMGTGRPVLISIPRDSYVPIPGHGSNKINAALAIGGPALLVKTVESVTGLRIDHYMGIGFGGLANVVSAVGGVRMCVKTAVPADPTGDSGFKGLAVGCHNLSGTQAIAFVRDRHSFATSDLQRIQDQRAFLSALLSKATSPGVYLNPFTALPFGSTAASAIAVDKGTSLYDLVQAAFALRNPQTGTVPIANANLQTSAGDSVEWDQTEALQLFKALQEGKAVPAGLLSGTQVG
jgi:LCP family protein required for cell wall assembly